MELKIFRDALPAAGTNCTLKAELPLETEILISDYLPPVFKLVKCFVRPVVLQKRLQPGKLQLEGYLRCVVYYQGEDGAGLCQTEQKLPFTKLLDLPEFVFSAWAVQVEGQTEYLNCRTVNPRRIEVRGAYGLVVSVHTQVKTDVITALSDGGVEQKLVTLSGVRRAAVLEKLVTVEGEIRFPTPPAAVLDLSGNASVGDLKLLNGKAVAKGGLVVSCAWRAEGDPVLQSQSVNLNFNQVLDVDGLSEDCRCLCVAEPVGFTLTEGEGEEPSRLTATLMLRLRAWRPYQLQCVADAFSTKFETEQTPQTVQTESLACTLDETVTLTGSGPLPDAGAKILACFASFGPALLAYRENNWELTSRVTVTAFGENSLNCNALESDDNGFVVNSSNLKVDVVLIGSNNLAADTAGRDHFIAGSKSVNHLLVFFLTFLLRTDQKEPENGKNEDHYAERREHAFKSAGLRSSARGCLCICFRNKQFKTPTMRYGFTEGSENFSTSTA